MVINKRINSRIVFVIIIIGIVSYIFWQGRQMDKDLENGNGILTTGTIKSLFFTRSGVLVTVIFKYKNQIVQTDFKTPYTDSLKEGRIVKLWFSKLHPKDGIKFVEVIQDYPAKQ
jgi:hypothetical protein